MFAVQRFVYFDNRYLVTLKVPYFGTQATKEPEFCSFLTVSLQSQLYFVAVTFSIVCFCDRNCKIGFIFIIRRIISSIHIALRFLLFHAKNSRKYHCQNFGEGRTFLTVI